VNPELTHRIVDANGIRLHVVEQGTGPLIVLCHGSLHAGIPGDNNSPRSRTQDGPRLPWTCGATAEAINRPR